MAKEIKRKPEPTVSERKEKLLALIEAYKLQNPVKAKAKAKEGEFAKKLAALS